MQCDSAVRSTMSSPHQSGQCEVRIGVSGQVASGFGPRANRTAFDVSIKWGIPSKCVRHSGPAGTVVYLQRIQPRWKRAGDVPNLSGPNFMRE